MSTRPGMLNAERGRGPGLGVKIMKGIGLLSSLVLCIMIVSVLNVGSSDAAVDFGVCASCHGANHHSGSPDPAAAWTGQTGTGPMASVGCSTACHASPPATGAHPLHAAPSVTNLTYGDTTTSTATQYQFGCGHCHPMTVTDKATHETARSANVNLTSGTGIGQTGNQVCTECHGIGPHGGTSDSFCLDCHKTIQGTYRAVVQSGASRNHHATACLGCHAPSATDGRIPHDEVAPLTTDASCIACHASTQGSFPPVASMAGVNHSRANSYTPQACIGCHGFPGIPATISNACYQCHGGTGNRSAPNVPHLDDGPLTTAFAVMHAAAGSDLVISALSISGTTTTGPGGPLTVVASTWNRGTGNAGHSITKFYLAPNSCSGTPQIELTGSTDVASLAAGATYAPGALTVTVPGTTGVGTYYLVAMADATMLVGEVNASGDAETNNSRCATTPVTIAAGSADLTISVAGGSTAGTRGQKINVNYNTWNRGTGAAGASASKVYLRCTGVADALLDSRAIAGLAAGATDTYATHQTQNVIPANSPTGTCSLVFVADADSQVAESSETNNSKTVAIGIR
jgi:hypothetical protein